LQSERLLRHKRNSSACFQEKRKELKELETKSFHFLRETFSKWQQKLTDGIKDKSIVIVVMPDYRKADS